MLVLTRREGEWIDLTIPAGDSVRTVRIGVQRIRDKTEESESKVSLGIEASREIVILRDDAKKRCL